MFFFVIFLEKSIPSITNEKILFLLFPTCKNIFSVLASSIVLSELKLPNPLGVLFGLTGSTISSPSPKNL